MEMRCYRKILRISYKRLCYQRGSPCQDPTGNRTTRSPHYHRKETQTTVVRTCLPFIRSGQNHLAKHSERGKKTRQTEEEVGRQHQGMGRPGVRQVPEGSGEQGKMKETGCEIICGASATLVVKGLMMMMIFFYYHFLVVSHVCIHVFVHVCVCVCACMCVCVFKMLCSL